ncbi:ribose 5-phosphate isomerase B [Spiroplasma clarkii]|uniref:Ribose 5-phosphate isomerase B n=1 Tax=Spiroplasma clarkii TaxID=2139 RepID=A0A2K8KHS2_9MOLU|nr:ribose 5-phosphate isomerase B [Spiroplasma clarkii]ATX70792.1 ribose 5-phosphate isomerase B [Spiroplasma clarkii]
MKIAIGNDHVGIELKAAILNHLKTKPNLEVIDCGTNSLERTDYPIYGKKVAKLVANQVADLGILICGTGVGITLAANKVPNIRAVVCSEPYTAKLSKEHNNTNILGLGSRVVGSNLALMIIDEWLAAKFEGGRHKKRIDMLEV